ncbi:MAG: iron ABC transporter permease, partial [Lacrimispora sp.]
GSISSVSLLAFLGAVGATGAVLFLASVGGQATSGKLILSGTIINAICTSFSNFIISVAGDGNGMLSIKFWTMGSLTRGSWNNLILPSCVVAVCTVFFLSQYRTLNTMLLGDEAASTLGVNLSFYRKLYMAAAALLTGVLVSACGVIGFVGLMIPHIARAAVGADHRRLLPITVLLGGDISGLGGCTGKGCDTKWGACHRNCDIYDWCTFLCLYFNKTALPFWLRRFEYGCYCTGFKGSFSGK